MKVKRMGITEILRRIWLFSANKIKSSESVSKQPTQLIVELNSSLRHIIVTILSLAFSLKVFLDLLHDHYVQKAHLLNSYRIFSSVVYSLRSHV